MRAGTLRFLGIVLTVASATSALAEPPPGERPALGLERITQQQIVSDELTLDQIRAHGMTIFTTSFNKLDGYGDGPMDIQDSLNPGGRPTLQGNGTLLRVNGLDAQSCLDCHSIVSSATAPPTLGVGGVGTANNNAIIMPSEIDSADLGDLDGAADFNGRFANPPFVFGAGGVELLAIEMTRDLQALRKKAINAPGQPVRLLTKEVDFGTIVYDGVDLDLGNVQGIDDDLVVRPFGRKGNFATVREFDIDAMRFHFGMQPAEAVGDGIDGDGDGVIDEILRGELSALSVFITTLERPVAEPLDGDARAGFTTFRQIGCAGCHVPALETSSELLPLRVPEDPLDPAANVFLSVNLSKPIAGFAPNGAGGVTVPLFADLKRHDMGPGLAENFALADAETNASFTTARLWGVADTAPYLHDGRATTLTEAIEAHGGEAQAVRDRFVSLSDADKVALLSFLRTLRTPGRHAVPAIPVLRPEAERR